MRAASLGDWTGGTISPVHLAGCGPGKILSVTARTSAVVIAGLAGATGELTELSRGGWTGEVGDEAPTEWALPGTGKQNGQYEHCHSHRQGARAAAISRIHHPSDALGG
jgi:hypothetical protein